MPEIDPFGLLYPHWSLIMYHLGGRLVLTGKWVPLSLSPSTLFVRRLFGGSLSTLLEAFDVRE